jgi:DNA-binding NarL/FixJ family response regulator
VELAEGDAGAAIVTLRRAWRAWQVIGAPYEAAQVRVLIAAACSVLGDTDGAEMELDAARWVFHDLGATPDLARITEVTDGPALAGRLTTREVEVVRLVARGSTNRDVGRELYISEKTVARHLSNIFCKLGISSRSAATAWAYEQGLMDASSPGAPT